MPEPSNQQNDVETPVQICRKNLIQAVENDDKDEVRRLIYDRVAVDETDNRGRNALFEAVRSCNGTLVHLLVEEGKAFVNARDRYGRTPLFYAITQSKEIAEYLIQNGADVNLKDFSNRSALSFFVENCMMNENIPLSSLTSDKADEFEMLKDSSEDDVNHNIIKAILSIVFCKLPLMCASSKISIDKTRRLNQETIDKIRENFISALKVASTYFAESDATKKTIDNVLQACEEKKTFSDMCDDLIGKLVNIGAEPSFADSDGNTAFHYAACLPWMGVSEETVKKICGKLQSFGVPLNKENHEDETPLLFCLSVSIAHLEDDKSTAVKTVVEVCKFLVSRGSNLKETNQEGQSVFHLVIKLFQQGFEITEESIRKEIIDETMNILHLFSSDRLRKGHMINKGDSHLNSPLHYWATLTLPSHTDYSNSNLFEETLEGIFEYLMELGATLNPRNEDEETPLQICKTWRAFKLLLHKGANTNDVDSSGRSPIIKAVRNKTCFKPDFDQSDHESVIREFIDAGADVNITDKEGKTALFYAVQQSNNESVVRALTDGGADVNITDKEGKTALFYAVQQRNNESVVHALIHAGAYVNITDKEGKTALFYAVDKGNEKMVHKLIKRGADINAKDKDGKTPLFHAVLKDEQENTQLIEPEKISKKLRQLVKLGANPNSVDSDRNTALHHAIQLPRDGVPKDRVLYICKQLKEVRASIHIKNLENETPLLRCLVCITNNTASDGYRQWTDGVMTQIAVCRFLIEQGASIEEKIQSGQSALHLSLQFLRQVLLDEEFGKTVLKEHIELLREILSSYKEKALLAVDKDNRGNTPLHIWANLELPPGHEYSSTISDGNTFYEILKMIFYHFGVSEAQLNVKNENGETPLHLCRTWTAVELLLDAGANQNVVDSSGRTPLLVLAKNTNLGNNRQFYPDVLLANDEFWRKIIDKGLDPWTVDIDHESLLSVLMESESHDLARALLDVACEDISKIRSRPLILFSILKALCKDKLPNAQWKKDAAEKFINLTKCPVNGNAKEDSPLHYCCRTIVEASKRSPIEEMKTTVHWSMVKLLRSFGADYEIPDATNKSCLDIAEECTALKDLLMEPIPFDKFPIEIKNWRSVSKEHKSCLSKVAKHLESKHVKSYCYHPEPLAKGSFGAVFAGIDEEDGREVAIKRIQNVQIERPEDKREITNLTALADCEQVVRYFFYFKDEDFSYIVLELMEGNLDHLVLDNTIQMDTKVSLCQDIVKGVKFIHDHEILHRDLKPRNILYKCHPKLCLKIADFGLSRWMDSTGSSISVYGMNVGTRCWIAPEVLKSTSGKAHSKSSDVFASGLVLHYVLSEKTHPFAHRKDAPQHETEANISNGKMEGWDDSLCPEAAHLLKAMLDGDESKRPSADKALDHPFFWSKKKKLDLLNAVGNQPEFGFPRTRRTLPLTTVETDLETSFGTIVKYVDWNDPGYVHMPAIYAEMTTKRGYNTNSVVELVRFIRNAYAHATALPKAIQDQLLKDFVCFEYFPNLVMEVYKAVTTHGWDQTRQEIKKMMDT